MVTRSHATNSLNILLFKQSPLWPASSPQFSSYFLESTAIGYSSSKPSICITELLLLMAIAPLPLSTWEHARTVFLLHISSNLLTISFISRALSPGRWSSRHLLLRPMKSSSWCLCVAEQAFSGSQFRLPTHCSPPNSESHVYILEVFVPTVSLVLCPVTTFIGILLL